jgi:hypothetical protein
VVTTSYVVRLSLSVAQLGSQGRASRTLKATAGIHRFIAYFLKQKSFEQKEQRNIKTLSLYSVIFKECILLC